MTSVKDFKDKRKEFEKLSDEDLQLAWDSFQIKYAGQYKR